MTGERTRKRGGVTLKMSDKHSAKLAILTYKAIKPLRQLTRCWIEILTERELEFTAQLASIIFKGGAQPTQKLLRLPLQKVTI